MEIDTKSRPGDFIETPVGHVEELQFYRKCVGET